MKTANRLQLSGFNPTGASTAVTYTIASQQVVDVAYQFNPISIDVGNLVLQADGLTRGIRPGRSAYTITDIPFAIITSIQEVDPSTFEAIGAPLNPPQGYGRGGYGMGGYGVGNSGDYQFVVNDPTTRFSAFEDSVIIFNSSALGLTYAVTYLYNPELQAIHSFCRSDFERVTGADVLPKIYVPAFVDIPLSIRRDPKNLTTPANPALILLVQNLISAVQSPAGLTATAIDTLLRGQGVLSVQVPFVMTATIYNPDGSVSIIQSEDVLQLPTVVLPSQTSQYTTPRISHFYPNSITMTSV
jgi:hypothetical protein